MSALKSIEEATRDFPSDLASLRDEISKLTASVSDLVSKHATATGGAVMDAVDDARRKAAETASDAGRKVAETASDAQDRMSGASDQLQAAIERNPFAAVLLALSAGLFIGMVSRGRG